MRKHEDDGKVWLHTGTAEMRKEQEQELEAANKRLEAAKTKLEAVKEK